MNIIRFLFQTLISLKNRFLQASWKKKLVIIAIALIALFFLTSPLRVKTPQYETATVTRETVSDIVSESGNVQSAAQFDVYSPTTGYVEEVYVENGETVEENQQLFKVKSAATEKEKADASSNLFQAQIALQSAQANMNSLQAALFKANQAFVTDRGVKNPSDDQKADPVYIEENATWLAAEAQYKNQQTVINQAQSALSSASLAYNATQNATVKSPAAGTVANLTAQVGEKVNAKDPTSANNKPELIVGNFTHNLISINLNEVDVDKIQPEQTVNLVFDAKRGKTYKGHVVSVALVGENNAGVITYNTRIAIDDEDNNIKPGMTVTASISTQKHENVLTVPNNAIKPYKNAKAVLVPGAGGDKVNGKILPFHYIPVRTGIKGVSRTEVISGVTDGEKVVTNTGNLLKTGQ